MARLASLIAAVAGAAIAFTTGWILGYVLAPMEDPKPPTITIHNPPATPRQAERCPVCGWHPTDPSHEVTNQPRRRGEHV